MLVRRHKQTATVPDSGDEPNRPRAYAALRAPYASHGRARRPALARLFNAIDAVTDADSASGSPFVGCRQRSDFCDHAGKASVAVRERYGRSAVDKP